jgi:hypothetical protein
MGEEFYLDGEELNKESQLSVYDETKVKLIEKIEKKLKECKDNLNYSERGEFETNLSIVIKQIEAVTNVMQLEEHKDQIDENKILEELERIQNSVKELSFNDLKEIEKKSKEQQVADVEDSSKNDDNFDF